MVYCAALESPSPETRMKPNRSLLVIALFIGITIACDAALPTDEPPGVGEKAEHGYAVSGPVIFALEHYKADNCEYPETLAELVPDYLSAVPSMDEVLDFSYISADDSFEFSFHYIGPGLNTCTYTPEEKWQCSGAY
jgi:hypothetical protein